MLCMVLSDVVFIKIQTFHVAVEWKGCFILLLLGNAPICPSTVLECSCCKIHRYVAAPVSLRIRVLRAHVQFRIWSVPVSTGKIRNNVFPHFFYLWARVCWPLLLPFYDYNLSISTLRTIPRLTTVPYRTSAHLYKQGTVPVLTTVPYLSNFVYQYQVT